MKATPIRLSLGPQFLLPILLLVPTALTAQQPQRTLLRAGHVIDVHTGKEAADKTIIVTGDKITAIAATASTPAQAGDKEIDLRGLTVLPGMIDAHTHLTMNTDFDPYVELTTTPMKEALNGVINANTTLMAGFTTVRNVGANGYSDVMLRDEINAGHFPGPHMLVSGPPLGITGGHCDDNLLPFEYPRHRRWSGRRHCGGATQGPAKHQVWRGPHQDLRNRRSVVKGGRSAGFASTTPASRR